MLRIELDWAGDEEPLYGPQTFEGEFTEIEVQPGQAKGPAGWPTVIVYASGVDAATAGPKLWAWLLENYDQDETVVSELASEAAWV